MLLECTSEGACWSVGATEEESDSTYIPGNVFAYSFLGLVIFGFDSVQGGLTLATATVGGSLVEWDALPCLGC